VRVFRQDTEPEKPGKNLRQDPNTPFESTLWPPASGKENLLSIHPERIPRVLQHRRKHQKLKMSSTLGGSIWLTLIDRNLTSDIITLVVGPDQRLFAAHKDILCRSPYFEAACRNHFFDSYAKRLIISDEAPEILSSVLEYLYKGDYYPRLLHDKRKDTWELEDRAGDGATESTIFHPAAGVRLLKDTVI
jgi:BTB/POZ domain